MLFLKTDMYWLNISLNFPEFSSYEIIIIIKNISRSNGDRMNEKLLRLVSESYPFARLLGLREDWI